MKKSRILGAVCAVFSFISMSSQAALIPVLGGQAYYDDVADLTWLANANLAGTTMTWAAANAWAAGLNISGVTGWRLPDTVDVGNDGATYTNIYQGVDYGYNITTHSEMSNMFFNVLGNTAYYDTSGTPTGCPGSPNYCLTNTGPFSNLQSSFYWSSTEYAPDPTNAWVFDFGYGLQTNPNKGSNGYAWAVQSGNAGVVPVPAAVWLFGSGLLALVGIGKQRRR
jgi:hypothetical protein